MKIKILKKRYWRGGFLQVGQELNVPPIHAKILLADGSAEEVKDTAPESAMLEPPREAAVVKRPRGRPRKVRPA